jgi:hypothetical protein
MARTPLTGRSQKHGCGGLAERSVRSETAAKGTAITLVTCNLPRSERRLRHLKMPADGPSPFARGRGCASPSSDAAPGTAACQPDCMRCPLRDEEVRTPGVGA